MSGPGNAAQHQHLSGDCVPRRVWPSLANDTLGPGGLCKPVVSAAALGCLLSFTLLTWTLRRLCFEMTVDPLSHPTSALYGWGILTSLTALLVYGNPKELWRSKAHRRDDQVAESMGSLATIPPYSSGSWQAGKEVLTAITAEPGLLVAIGCWVNLETEEPSVPWWHCPKGANQAAVSPACFHCHSGDIGWWSLTFPHVAQVALCFASLPGSSPPEQVVKTLVTSATTEAGRASWGSHSLFRLCFF